MIKLSICIPVYNYDCTPLVKSLLDLMDYEMELLIGDDGSERSIEQQYGDLFYSYAKSTTNLINISDSIRFVTSKTNIGRAAIRNLLANSANGKWLLFIDCDAQLNDDKYLKRYLDIINRNDIPEVICGGTLSPNMCPSPLVSLRWKYEYGYWKSRTVEQRKQSPYHSFTTFNFLIRRETFLNYSFNEECVGYGHEDTLFGNTLSQARIPILHIMNPLLHMGLDTNAEFLRKTEEQLRSLRKYHNVLKENYTLLYYYARAKKVHIAWLIRCWHFVFGALEKRNLLSKHPSLKLFSLYKLGYYASLKQS